MEHRRRLEALRDRFLAVSLRSRTLRLTRTSKSGALDLTRLPPTNLAWVVKVLGAPTDPPVAPGAIADVAADSPLSVDVATLGQAARTQRMETGSDDLAVGFPFLEGRAPDGTWLRAPLFLYPVTLGQTTRGKLRWTLQPSGPGALNTTLCETLARLCRVRLSEEDFAARDEDQLFKVDDGTWKSILDTLRATGLEVDAPASLPSAPLPLEARTEEDRSSQPAGRFAMRFHLVLGRFPASASTVVNDYEALLAGLDQGGSTAQLLGPVGQALLSFDDDEAERAATVEAPESDAADAARGLSRWQVLPSDASQDEVFFALERNESARTPGLVVQGPPGTGKSQLITNLLGATIARGDRVLLVCQKRAALDVVAERLERVGLSEPVAVVHDIQRDRASLFEAIAQTVDTALASSAQSAAHSKVEAGFARAEAEVERRLATSQGAFERLVADDPKTPSLVELDEALLSTPGPVLASVEEVSRRPDLLAALDEVTLDTLPAHLDTLEQLAEVARPFAPDHPLAHRTDWAAHGEAELGAIRFRLQALDSAMRAWAPHATRPGALRNDVLDGNRLLLAEARPLAELAGDEDRRLGHALFLAWHGDVHGQEQLARLRDAHATLGRVPVELVTRPRAEVEALRGDISKIERFRRRWWRVFLPAWWLLRGLPRRVTAGFSRPVALADEVTGLGSLCDHALAWQELLAELPEHPIFHLEGVGEPRFLERPIAALERGFRVKMLEGRVRQALASHGAPFSDPGGVDSWRGDSPSRFLVAVAAEHARAAALDAVDQALQALRTDFEASFLDALRRELLLDVGAAETSLRRIITAAPDMVKCRDLDRALAAEPRWVAVFLKRWSPRAEPRAAGRAAVLSAWLHARLGGTDPEALERPLVDTKLTRHIADALAEGRNLAGHAALERYRARLAEGVAARQKELQKLLADVQKKRYRPTLRQLYERHGDALSLVRPIWFCSPEAVAALFPLAASLFDLVIFDEASQCPVEAAIPALVRGKVAIVAGDDKQMPPSHFFAASLDEDEDEEGALLAAQSILTLARVALPTTTLSWHYRCRHEELIAFSNAAFYGKKLATAPHASERARLPCEGLKWIAVEGRWKDQTNAVEAERVVDLVAEVLSQSLESGAPPTLGIVAMNRPQAELIERRIEARAANDEAFRALWQRDLERPIIDQLFVRNLENVQGDERDVMLLSLGYGPSERGGKVHARFGPLGLEGGEKRLNVAITRARLGLTVVTSCQPEDLSVDGTTHPGPKLLRAFLSFARAVSRGAQETVGPASGGPSASSREALDLLARAAALTGAPAASRAQARSLRLVGESTAEAMARALEARGLTVERSLGLGRLSLDLAVRRMDDTVFRVGLDTSGFLSRRRALLRDHHVPVFWERAGWTLLRVTPGAWRRDPAAVIRRIETALDGGAKRR